MLSQLSWYSMETMQDALQSYGLNEKETRLYVAAISLGVASVMQLARRAGLKRPTTYLILESLLDQGLLVAIPKGKKTYYKAEDPIYFSKTLMKKQSKMQAVLPALQELYMRNSSHPRIRFYEGKDKLMRLYEEIFRSKEIWAMVSIDGFLRVFNEDDEKHFFRILIRHNGAIYDIMENTKMARIFSRLPYRTAVGKVRLLDRGARIATDILVFHDSVATISFDSMVAAVIEDAHIAESMKMMVQCMWNHALPVASEK